MIYGYDKTIHGTTILNVEVDKKTGKVVSVWFRCMALPFDVREVGPERAKEMRRMTKEVNVKESIVAVDVRSGDFQEGTVIEEMK